MPDIIQLLPDSVANQIAAGEVVQRPASAVKELLENAIDAGASEISLIIKNAGKTLIQVVDNGSGMSETDARLCLERHATSKIKTADDLFALKTMGFRGEAVPSIAAISQMEIKTKTEGQDLGSHIILEGSKVLNQDFCQSPKGSSFSVKNLFFNVPARRNFLKSNPVEVKHIIEEFIRVALIHPEINFNMDNDGQEVYRLKSSRFKQRVIAIFGKKYDQRLVPVEEETDIVKLSGFIGKPEFARKTRGEQYLFVNQRFIKSAYLNHAIQAAYEEVLPKELFPSYFICMEIDPAKIDINIHPTKTEVKFEEERAIYAILRTAARQALGKFNIAPSLDFEQEESFDVPMLKRNEGIQMPQVKIDPDFNPFENRSSKRQNSTTSYSTPKKEAVDPNWQALFQSENESKQTALNVEAEEKQTATKTGNKAIQLHRKYLLTQIKSGFILIDQHRAHQRILIEELSQNLAHQTANSQQLLFPEEVELSASDFALIQGLLHEIRALGFNLEQFGQNSLVVNGIPEASKEENAVKLIEGLLEEFKMNQSELRNKPKINLIHSLAKSMSITSGTELKDEEMQHLIDLLFATEMPYHLPNGKPIILNFGMDELDKKFKYS